MGYKYGVWYVYPKGIFPTKHVGHFTVTCFMEKKMLEISIMNY